MPWAWRDADLGQELRATAGHDVSPTPVLSGMAREALTRVGVEGRDRSLPGRPGRDFLLIPALAGTASPAAPRGGDKITAVNDINGARGGECGLCGRTVERLTRHHLVPKTRHKNKRNKKTFDRQEIHRTVGLCPPCHRHIHTALNNKELEREYNTLESLRSHPNIRKFIAWIGKKPHGTATAHPRLDPRRGDTSPP